MATSETKVYDSFVAFTLDHLLETSVQEQVYESVPFLKVLEKNKKYFDGGDSIFELIRTAKSTAVGTLTPNGNINVTPQKNSTRAFSKPAHYYASIAISEIEMDLNSGKEGIYKILADATTEAGETLSDQLSQDMWSTGDGTDGHLIGVQHLVADNPTSGTVLGVDSATVDTWRNDYSASAVDFSLGSAPFVTTAENAMQDMLDKSTYGTRGPTWYWSGQALYTAYGKAWRARGHYVPTTVNAETGVRTATFAELPYKFDRHCPASHIYAIDMNAIKLWVHSKRNFVKEGPIQSPNNEGTFYRTLVTLQLCANERRTSAVRSNVSVGS